MEIAGIDYEPWVKPTPYTAKWTMTESELRDRISKANAIAEDESKRDVIRQRASRDLEKL